MNPLSLALPALASCWAMATSLAVTKIALRRPRVRQLGRRPADVPSISVLKPLCGADPSLYENLRSFFEQDYPTFQLVFGFQDACDPARQVVAELCERYPHVDAYIALHSFAEGLNPKVRNLRGMLPAARHPLLVISDSNVRAPRHYLREAAEKWAADPDIGLVTNLFYGSEGNTVASWVEHVQLAGFVAGGAAVPSLLGQASVVGKSMLLSRGDLEAIGGLAGVADVLAEDYVIGQRIQARGRRIAIATTVLQNVVGDLTMKALLARHARWGMMRLRLHPWAFWMEPLMSPLVAFPLLLLAVGQLAWLWLALAWFVRDGVSWMVLTRRLSFWHPLALSAVRDVSMLVAWLLALSARHVTWRGTRVRVGPGTRLSVDVV